MIEGSDDVAQLAMSLIKLSRSAPELSDIERAAMELGAVLLLNHAREWEGTDLPSYVERHPEASFVNTIANGLKHAKPVVRTAGSIEQRAVLFEDWDFWHAPHEHPTVFVMIGDIQYSISALVTKFAERIIHEASVKIEGETP